MVACTAVKDVPDGTWIFLDLRRVFAYKIVMTAFNHLAGAWVVLHPEPGAELSWADGLEALVTFVADEQLWLKIFKTDTDWILGQINVHQVEALPPGTRFLQV